VLDNVGATLPKRDAVDNRIIETVKTGKIFYTESGQTGIGKQFIKRRLPEDSYKQGISTHPSQVGGYLNTKARPYKDADNDGMPDEYEGRMALTQNDASDAMKDKDKNGYSNIEDYLNSLVNIKNVMPVATIKSNEEQGFKIRFEKIIVMSSHNKIVLLFVKA
jgi:hypothetical protein